MREQEQDSSGGCSKCGAPFQEACMCPTEGQSNVIDIKDWRKKRAELPADDGLVDGVAALPADGVSVDKISGDSEERAEQDRILTELRSLSEELKARITLARKNKEPVAMYNFLQGLNGRVIGQIGRISSKRRISSSDSSNIEILRKECSDVLGK